MIGDIYLGNYERMYVKCLEILNDLEHLLEHLFGLVVYEND